MKLLLDESLPRGLKKDLAGHDVTTVPEQGWAGKSNGELLELAEEDFDAFITADQNLEYQQDMAQFSIAVIVLAGKTNRLADLRHLIGELCTALDSIQPGQVVRISASERAK